MPEYHLPSGTPVIYTPPADVAAASGLPDVIPALVSGEDGLLTAYGMQWDVPEEHFIPAGELGPWVAALADDIERRIRAIGRTADPETLHRMEDACHYFALKAIANGERDHQAIAKAALRTAGFEFQRWFA